MESVPAFRLALDGAAMVGGLNLHADKPHAFDIAAAGPVPKGPRPT